MKITLQPEAILLVLPHVSDDESRPLLNHVFLRAGGTAVATSGATLAAHHLAHDAQDDHLIEFPKGAAAVFCQAARRGYPVILDTETKIAQCFEIQKTFVFDVYQDPSAYPNFLEVLPEKKGDFNAIGILGVNSEYAGMFGERATLYFQSPDSAVVVTIFGNPNFYGLLMPLRTADDEAIKREQWSKGVPHLPPPWLTGKPATPKKKRSRGKKQG